MDDRITSTTGTQRASDFRSNVKERDGLQCIFTGDDVTDAVHIIPKAKGDEVSPIIMTILCLKPASSTLP